MRSALLPRCPHRALLAVILLLSGSLGACGDDDSAAQPQSDFGTIAYVVTECAETALAESPTGTQRLFVQRGDNAPVPVVAHPIFGPPSPFAFCALIAQDRFGPGFTIAGVFQRLAVVPDGSGVVFEVTDGLAFCNEDLCLRPPPLPPGGSGMFYVRSDGTGMRRLGEASREPIFFNGANALLILPSIAISPSGRLITFTDRGPGPDGEAAAQIATQGIAGGSKRFVTRLPPGQPTADFPDTCCPGFVDERTLAFASSSNPDNLNPEGIFGLFTVSTTGENLTRLPPTKVGEDSEIDPTFVSPSGRPDVSLLLSDEPAHSGPPGPIQEILLVDGTNYLQLTDFQRSDTTNPTIDLHDARVLFVGSADPAGTNASNNCQLFTVDTTGARLTQISAFGEVDHSEFGCAFGPRGGGCAILIVGYEAGTDTVLLYSSCDPFGTNPDGAQIFTMRADGSSLRQVTHTRGLVVGPGTLTAEIPGPVAYQGAD